MARRLSAKRRDAAINQLLWDLGCFMDEKLAPIQHPADHACVGMQTLLEILAALLAKLSSSEDDLADLVANVQEDLLFHGMRCRAAHAENVTAVTRAIVGRAAVH